MADEPIYWGWATKIWLLIHGLGKEFEENAYILVMPSGIESLDLFHIFSLSCSLEILEVPWLTWWVILLSKNSYPRSVWARVGFPYFNYVWSRLWTVPCWLYPRIQPDLSNSLLLLFRYPISYYLFGLGNSGLCPCRMGRWSGWIPWRSQLESPLPSLLIAFESFCIVGKRRVSLA